jgi:hypothetical protein
MRFHWPAFLLSLGALLTANASDSQCQYDTQATPDFLFDRSPFGAQCADRTPGVRVVIFPKASYLRTRAETLTLSRAEVPALTITADPSNLVEVTGANADEWSLRFCAQGEGNSEGEAREHLQSISMSRLGSADSLNSSGLGHMVGARGKLLVEAPADAPIVIHASFAAVEIRDMTGPVRVTATHGRAKILDTTGKVDATGSVVGFAGSRGTVNLSAEAEVNIEAEHCPLQRLIGCMGATLRPRACPSCLSNAFSSVRKPSRRFCLSHRFLPQSEARRERRIVCVHVRRRRQYAARAGASAVRTCGGRD